MSLTPKQIADGWIEWNGGECPIKDERTRHQVMIQGGVTSNTVAKASEWNWQGKVAYRIIEAHGADAEPARPTPFPADYSELVFDADGWSQTIIVDGKRPEWLRDDDGISAIIRTDGYSGHWNESWQWELAIRVRRREPKRETVTGWLCHVPAHVGATRVSYDLIDGKPDLSTLKIAEGA